MLECGCPDISIIPIERKIPDDITINTNSANITLKNDRDNIECLKKQIICEYYSIINQLECGIQPDVKLILEEISYIQNYEYKKLFE